LLCLGEEIRNACTQALGEKKREGLGKRKKHHGSHASKIVSVPPTCSASEPNVLRPADAKKNGAWEPVLEKFTCKKRPQQKENLKKEKKPAVEVPKLVLPIIDGDPLKWKGKKPPLCLDADRPIKDDRRLLVSSPTKEGTPEDTPPSSTEPQEGRPLELPSIGGKKKKASLKVGGDDDNEALSHASLTSERKKINKETTKGASVYRRQSPSSWGTVSRSSKRALAMLDVYPILWEEGGEGQYPGGPSKVQKLSRGDTENSRPTSKSRSAEGESQTSTSPSHFTPKFPKAARELTALGTPGTGPHVSKEENPYQKQERLREEGKARKLFGQSCAKIRGVAKQVFSSLEQTIDSVLTSLEEIECPKARQARILPSNKKPSGAVEFVDIRDPETNEVRRQFLSLEAPSSREALSRQSQKRAAEISPRTAIRLELLSLAGSAKRLCEIMDLNMNGDISCVEFCEGAKYLAISSSMKLPKMFNLFDHDRDSCITIEELLGFEYDPKKNLEMTLNSWWFDYSRRTDKMDTCGLPIWRSRDTAGKSEAYIMKRKKKGDLEKKVMKQFFADGSRFMVSDKYLKGRGGGLDGCNPDHSLQEAEIMQQKGIRIKRLIFDMRLARHELILSRKTMSQLVGVPAKAITRRKNEQKQKIEKARRLLVDDTRTHTVPSQTIVSSSLRHGTAPKVSEAEMEMRLLEKRFDVPMPNLEYIREKFNYWDMDRGGGLSKREFSLMMHECLRHIDGNIHTQAKINRFWQNVDNGSGNVSFSNFIEWFVNEETSKKYFSLIDHITSRKSSSEASHQGHQ